MILSNRCWICGGNIRFEILWAQKSGLNEISINKCMFLCWSKASLKLPIRFCSNLHKTVILYQDRKYFIIDLHSGKYFIFGLSIRCVHLSKTGPHLGALYENQSLRNYFILLSVLNGNRIRIEGNGWKPNSLGRYHSNDINEACTKRNEKVIVSYWYRVFKVRKSWLTTKKIKT